jgi:hypothetical protein
MGRTLTIEQISSASESTAKLCEDGLVMLNFQAQRSHRDEEDVQRTVYNENKRTL